MRPSAESQTATVAVPAVLAAAVEQARAAVAEFSGADTVGEHLGVDYEDATAATHRFAALLPGYQGWQWAVVVAAIPGAAHSTISEVVLVPGPTALLAPEWVPWDQRIRPGDLGPGDLLAPPADDPRLVPGYTSTGDPELDEVAGEIGLGRRWLMSPLGRAEAAQRWHDGEYGPDSAMARSTKRVCRDCGFYLPLAGALGTAFGACGNEMSADGRVVDAEYGCGAHSDTPAPAGTGSPAYDPYDDGVLEIVESDAATEISTAEPAEAPAEPVEAVAEPATVAPAETEPLEPEADTGAAATETPAEPPAEPGEPGTP
ncbi:DUF3027 domain-containing protein [Mycolicibacter sinensis]|uniref:DUF3027 domain-containing protein n=1 Tax=Mycolicibacter sinensis (strain JDM601) TaxID=875328 RepID=A0A1A2NWI4_MYCSD|nr:DUF3027 domain-containing protein [Mycolicibacter sinensis]OBH19440.1 hypothetical protein A5694_18760 [Mycolicibacter sinensis]OBI31125.1 hypothetical protein A5710_18640 [Mycolicibacter sinensis]